MTTGEFQTDRRGLIGGTLGALTITAMSGAIASPATKSQATLRKARPPRGSFGIVQPGIKRTAFFNAPIGMSGPELQAHWISTHARGLRTRGAQSIVFNLIDKDHSPEKRFDAVTEMVFDSDWAYEQEYLGARTPYI
jgi:hypothetical protein